MVDFHSGSSRWCYQYWPSILHHMVCPVAGILTLIGLGEAIVLSGKTKATFVYAKDRSVFGQTAASRAHGSKGSLISSPFEIQFRQFEISSNEENLTAKKNTTGTIYWTEHILLLDDIVCREGLVIDAVSGGIGLRNHTIPALPATVHGMTWTEDILWLEPDTVCVDTNWSISTEFLLTPFSAGGLSLGTNKWLLRDGDGLDRGLDANFSTFEDSISSPDLLGRAQLAAEIFVYHLSWLLNLDQSNISTGAYNITSDSDLITSFLGSGSHKAGLVFGGLEEPWWALNESTLDHTDIVVLDPALFNLSSFNLTLLFETELNTTFSVPSVVINSPWTSNGNTSDLTWSFGLDSCKSIKGSEVFKPGLVNVDCGYLITPPRLTKNASQDSPEEWKMSINVCASSPRALVKTVHFQYNDTGHDPTLDNLKIIKSEPKIYASSEDLPYWGIEGASLNLSIHEMQVLWGVVDKDFAESSALWTQQSEAFYIPATFEDGYDIYFGDSMAATRLPGIINALTYTNLFVQGTTFEYDGTTDQTMALKWVNLTSPPDTIDRIPRLIWTDIATNIMVGSKSVLSAFPDQKMEVQTFRRKITYNYVYAIPALICWIIWLGSVILILALLFSKEARSRLALSRLRRMINCLSVGRALAAAKTAGMNEQAADMSTKGWVGTYGKVEIDLSEC
ncbi:hypothetical protein DL98DRAFT_574021 [Cadophora sp. DSE1049]|nr:hypothetical protein DL98DRAFT_574021 [Cadophora sp. DSE1049]